METSWLPLLVSAAVLMTAIVLLLALCVDCRNHGPMVSIPQTVASEDYILSTDFRITNRFHSNTEQISSISPSNLPPSFPGSSDPGPWRQAGSFTLTKTDSNLSYENQGESLESDRDSSSYIVVLPDDASVVLPNGGRSSTSSSDTQSPYVNVQEPEEPEDTEEEDIPEYVNVDPSSSQEKSSLQTDEDESDEEGNYVNQSSKVLED